jgi:outer membrane protein assembly factor BamB
MKLARALILLPALLAACSTPPKDVDVYELSKFVPATAERDVDVKWGVNLDANLDRYLDTRPLLVDSQLYVADAEGVVRQLGLADGVEQWSQQFDREFSAGPNLAAGMLLLGTHDAQVMALQPDGGELLWQTTVSSEVLAAPQASGGRVIVRTADGKVFGLQASSGKQLWVFDKNVPLLSLRGNSRPLLINDMVVVGFANGKLVALSQHDGKLIWEISVAVPRGRSELERMVDVDAELHYADGVIYAVTYQGRIAALSASSGRTIWTREMSAYRSPVVDGSHLYVTDVDGQVWALDKSSGATLWKQDRLSALANTAPVPNGDSLLVGDRLGALYWLNREDGRLLGHVPAETLMLATGVDALADKLDEPLPNTQFWPELVGMAYAPIVAGEQILLSYRRGALAVMTAPPASAAGKN